MRHGMTKWMAAGAMAIALALAGCGGGGGADTAMMEEDPAVAQYASAHTAIEAAVMLVDGLSTASTDADVMAADAAVTAAMAAVTAGSDLSQEQVTALNMQIAAISSDLMVVKADRQAIADANAQAAEAERLRMEAEAEAERLRMEAEAEAERLRMEAEAEAERLRMEAAAAMAVTASRLHSGIIAPGGTGDDVRTGGYGTGDNTDDIAVTIGSATAVNLSEDDDATVASHHGWEGMMFTAEPMNGGTYEAVVYSNVGEATEGAMFSATYEYDAEEVEGANTELTVTTTDAAMQARIASPSFDQSAGTKAFELGENLARVVIPGSYHGVSGTYYCAPGTGGCSATVADDGFTLGGGTWTFKATDPEQRLMDVPDANYASYGWWLHKSEDGDTFTAGAFSDNHGADPNALAIAALRGTATYTGGAAGKYALSSSTGGTNDAGHFTADVELNATFAATHMISGSIDNFTGADGMPRDWSVGLNSSIVSAAGAIAGDPDDNTDTDPQMTVWTMGGTVGDAAGQWDGNLQEADEDSGVPMVASGTFYSVFGSEAKMVGAFGANVE